MRKPIPKALYGILAALALIPSCLQKEVPLPPPETVSLSFVAALPHPTRISGSTESAETAIHRLQVFVFAEDGLFEISGEADATSLVLDISLGTKEVFCLANMPPVDPAGIHSIQDLLSRGSFLSDNAPEHLAMWSRNTLQVFHGQTDPVIQNVSRLAARIQFSGLTNQSGQSLHLEALWAQNVAGNSTFDGSAPTLWHNRMGHTDAGMDALLYESLDTDVPAGSYYNTRHVFYVYPNPFQEALYGGLWAPRSTRLVLQSSLGGHTSYYPVTIPGPILANHSYNIANMVIRREGTSGPDKELNYTEIFYEVEDLASWEGEECTVELEKSGLSAIPSCMPIHL